MEYPRHKKLIFSILIVFFLSLLIVFWNMHSLVILPVIPKNSSPMIITVDASTSASQFAELLKDNHLISSTHCFKFIIRLKGLSHHLKAGVYQVNSGET